MQILYVTNQIIVFFGILNFLAPCLAQFTKFFLLFKPSKTAATQISRNTCCRTAAKWVKNPVALVG